MLTAATVPVTAPRIRVARRLGKRLATVARFAGNLAVAAVSVAVVGADMDH